MKPTTGSFRARHVTPPPRKTRLNLQRRPAPEPEDEVEARQRSSFWKWFLIVAFFHVVVIAIAYLLYSAMPVPKPPEQMISLLPPGDVVKGTPGQQQAHKLGPTTAASIAHHAPAPTPPTPVTHTKPVTPKPVAVQPPKPIPPKPIVKTDVPDIAQAKPVVKPPPPKPKVKVDLHLADAPSTAEEKPKHHPKKPAKKPDDSDDSDENNATAKTTTTGLSREQIAERLGEKMDAPGVKSAVKSGTSGSPDSHANSFADFYAAIRDQVMSQWQSPNLADETAVSPIVHIHVEKDGRVPTESVYLVRSSGNPTYDDSAIAAAKSLGYLHEPLPEGCPPDIPITFKLTR